MQLRIGETFLAASVPLCARNRFRALVEPKPEIQEAHPPQRVNFLYFSRFGSTASGPSRRFLSSS